MFSVAKREQARFERVRDLLAAFDMYTDPRASVMLDLSDDETPSDFPALAKRGLRLADAMRTEQLMKRLSARLGRPGKKVDREQRDYAIAPLRELGVVDKAYVKPQKDWPESGDDLVKVGRHFSKSGNNSYRLTDEARDLLDAPENTWTARLDDFVASDQRRRLRRLQKQAVATLVDTRNEGERHKALITATVNALRETRCAEFELVFIDDDDGRRVRDEWRPRLEELNLMPDEEKGRYPDALLVNALVRQLWFVDAVSSDGEVDEVRRADMEEWAAERGCTVAGFTTSYESWADAAKRQAKHKNLAVETTLWIAEDGGKVLFVQSLAG